MAALTILHHLSRKAILALALLLSLPSASLMAQAAKSTLSGHVIDAKTLLPIPYVSVIIVSGEGTMQGATTDETGAYAIHKVAQGTQVVRFSCVGYATALDTVSVQSSNIDLGTVALRPSSASLREVSVKAERMIMRASADKLEYEFKGDIDSRTLSVLEMLRKVPMVTVDARGNISVCGFSEFQVYVDGVPNPVITRSPTKVLRSMPASTVLRVEVITSPGARYDAEGSGGILNLVTQQSAPDAGIQRSFTAHTTLGTRRWGQDLGFSYTEGPWSIDALLMAEYEYQPSSPMGSELSIPGTDMRYTSWEEASQKMPFAMADISIRRRIDTLSSLSLNLTGTHMGMHEQGLNNLTYHGGLFADSLMLQAFSQSGFRQNSMDATLGYRRQIGANPCHLLTLTYQLSISPTHVTARHSYLDSALAAQYGLGNLASTNSESSLSHNLIADVTHPFSPTLSASLGTRLTAQYGSGNHFTQRLIVAAAYAEMEYHSKIFQAKGGLRNEQSWLSTIGVDRHDGAFVPTLSLEATPAEGHRIGMAYNLRLRRPTIEELEPSTDAYDPFVASHGNPSLDMERSHSFTLSYHLSRPRTTISASLNHLRIDQGIMQYAYLDQGQLRRTFGNVANSRLSTAHIYLSAALTPSTRLQTRCALTHANLSSEVLGARSRGWQLDGNITLQQQLPWQLKASAMIELMSRTRTLQGWESGMSLLTANISRSFCNDRWLLSLGATTSLSRHGAIIYHSHAQSPLFLSDAYFVIPSHMLSLSIGLNMGGDLGHPDDESIEQNTSSPNRPRRRR